VPALIAVVIAAVLGFALYYVFLARISAAQEDLVPVA
jgi:hypothetical protein